jgi:hypothetical protein
LLNVSGSLLQEEYIYRPEAKGGVIKPAIFTKASKVDAPWEAVGSDVRHTQIETRVSAKYGAVRTTIHHRSLARVI